MLLPTETYLGWKNTFGEVITIPPSTYSIFEPVRTPYTSLRLDRWPALFNWFDNAPCYCCKTFTANPSETDSFARVSFSDSVNGFVLDMDNGKPISYNYYCLQPFIHNTTNGCESFQNGTLFPDTSLILNPMQLISSPKPGLCFFITDAGKLFKTNNYSQDGWVMTIINQKIR